MYCQTVAYAPLLSPHPAKRKLVPAFNAFNKSMPRKPLETMELTKAAKPDLQVEVGSIPLIINAPMEVVWHILLSNAITEW